MLPSWESVSTNFALFHWVRFSDAITARWEFARIRMLIWSIKRMEQFYEGMAARRAGMDALGKATLPQSGRQKKHRSRLRKGIRHTWENAYGEFRYEV